MGLVDAPAISVGERVTGGGGEDELFWSTPLPQGDTNFCMIPSTGGDQAKIDDFPPLLLLQANRPQGRPRV